MHAGTCRIAPVTLIILSMLTGCTIMPTTIPTLIGPASTPIPLPTATPSPTAIPPATPTSAILTVEVMSPTAPSAGLPT